MIQISKKQIDERWDFLPDALREILYSEAYGDILWKISEENHLDEAKTKIIAELVAYIIYGFVHIEDLAKEISSELNLNSQIALSISQAINQKIFSSFRNVIDTNYKPAMPETLPTRQPGQAQAKTVINEIKPAEKPKTFSPLDILGRASFVTPPISPSIASKPSISSVSTAMPITPKPEAVQVSMDNLPPAVAGKEGLPAVPAAAGQEGPLIIHKEAQFQPLSENKRSLGGFFNFLGKDKKDEKPKISPIRARVEIGPETFGAVKKEEPQKAFTEIPKAKVVHYTDFSEPSLQNPFSRREEPEIKPIGQQVPPISKLPQSSPVPSPKPIFSGQPQPQQFRPAIKIDFHPQPQPQPNIDTDKKPSLRDLANPANMPQPSVPAPLQKPVLPAPFPNSFSAPVPPPTPTPKRVDFTVSAAVSPSASPEKPLPEKNFSSGGEIRLEEKKRNDETDNNKEKKNGDLGENIIDLRSFK